MFVSASLRLSDLKSAWMPSTGTQFGHRPTSLIASSGTPWTHLLCHRTRPDRPHTAALASRPGHRDAT